MAENNQNKYTTRQPLPNVVKIETMTEDEMKYYTTIFGDVALTAQHKLRSMLNRKPSIFYGFMQNDTLQIQNSAGWAESQVGSGGSTEKAGSISAASSKKGIINKFSSKLSLLTGAVSAVGQTLKNVFFNETVRNALGISMNVTGNATQKYYKSFSTSIPNITCGWYMPQQMQQAVLGMMRLHNMVYPQTLGYNKDLGDDIESALNAVTDTLDKNFSSGLAGNNTSDPSQEDTDFLSNASKLLSQVSGNTNGANVIANLSTALEEGAGINLTLQPLPVKLSIGNKAYFEPVVITGMNITMSKESFLKDFGNGRVKLIPQFITVDLTFDYWMVPNPHKNRTAYMGLPMFKNTPVQSNAPTIDDVFGGNR